MAWEIENYETPAGQPVVEKFIQKLDVAAKAKLIRIMDMLEMAGPELPMPYARPMGQGLYELRVRGKREVRIFYVFMVAQRIVLLHGFIKKTQVTPARELKLARHRQLEIT